MQTDVQGPREKDKILKERSLDWSWCSSFPFLLELIIYSSIYGIIEHPVPPAYSLVHSVIMFYCVFVLCLYLTVYFTWHLCCLGLFSLLVCCFSKLKTWALVSHICLVEGVFLWVKIRKVSGSNDILCSDGWVDGWVYHIYNHPDQGCQ